MSLNKTQFQQRHPSLNYDNPADRKAAAMAGRRDWLKTLNGGSAPVVIARAPANPRTRSAPSANRKARTKVVSPPKKDKPALSSTQKNQLKTLYKGQLEKARRRRDSGAIRQNQPALAARPITFAEDLCPWKQGLFHSYHKQLWILHKY